MASPATGSTMIAALARVGNSTPGVRKRKSHDGGAKKPHPKAGKSRHPAKTPKMHYAFVNEEHRDSEDYDEDEEHDEDDSEDRDEDEEDDEDAPRDTHLKHRKGPVGQETVHSKSRVMKKNINSQDSEESDAVETLTHLGDKPGDKPGDKSADNKSPHIGKGVLKVPCHICAGPIAVKVSGDLRLRNKESDDGCKICQKCYNELIENNKAKALALKKVAEMRVEKELSFPWNIGFGQYTCTEVFSGIEKGNYAYTHGDSFQISYNYSKHDLSKHISILISIANVNERTVNLKARAPAREFWAMREFLGHDPYPGACYISNPGLNIYEWEWTNIPNVVIYHSQLVSRFQALTGTIERCPMMFLNSSKEGVPIFTTSEDKNPVLYPFKNYFDFDINFAEKVSFELLGTGEKDEYTRVIFDKKCLLQPGNPYGINVVADDRSTNTIYMTMKYVSFKEYDGEILTVLHRLIARANYSVIGQFPFFIDEIRTLSFSSCGFGLETDNFKVKAHMEPILSKIPGILTAAKG